MRVLKFEYISILQRLLLLGAIIIVDRKINFLGKECWFKLESNLIENG